MTEYQGKGMTYDRIRSCKLHKDEDCHSNEDTSAVAGYAELFDLRDQALVMWAFELLVDSIHYVSELLLKICMVLRQTTELAKGVCCNFA